MSGININDTDKFNEVLSYLDESKTTVTNYNDDLTKIGEGLSGSVKSVYNTSSSSVKEMINNLLTKIESAKSHINTSLGVYYSVGDELKNKLNDIYDSIFNDEDYESKLVYVASGESKKLSYEEFIELVNNSEEYFKEQREKVYNEFLANMVVAGPTMIKKLGINVYNAVVENTYLCISDNKYGSDRYKKGLQDFKNKFAKEINSQYSNTDFVPKVYMENQNAYNRALLTLSFDTRDQLDMNDLLWNTFRKIDDRVSQNEYGISQGMYYLDSFYQAKDIINDAPKNTTPEKLLDYYTNEILNIKKQFDLTNSTNHVIADGTYNPDYDAWYDTIKNTKAFQKIKDLLPNDKFQIYDMTNKMDFLSAIYQYDGIETLQGVYYKYIGKCLNGDTPKEYITNGDLSRIILYSTENNVLNSLYQPIMETKKNLAAIDDSEKTSFLLFAKDLDTSDVKQENVIKSTRLLDLYWNYYCNGNDYTKYLEDWQLKAYTKILEHDKNLADKLFNLSEGGDRGILNEKIMEGYAFDVAKNRVKDMAGDNNNGTVIDEYLRSIVFSAAYGFGYGITDFTDGIADAFVADGKLNRRQMEKNNIMALLSGDYSLQTSYYNKDPKTMEMFSNDYSDDLIKTLKIKNFSREDIEDFINDCKNNKVPRYELEYYLGNISYEEFIRYQSVANLSDEDLAFYANLNNSAVPKWLADKTFKVSNSVGTMFIPVALSTLATALGPIGETSLSAFATNIGIASTIASYSTMGLSILGRNREALMVSGETDNAFIWTNSILHAVLETFGEMALGKILKPTKVTQYLKNNTVYNYPLLGKLINASDNLNSFLISTNCNPKLAKYLSKMAGEVLQENLENIVGYGIDTLTNACFGQIKLTSIDEMINDAWETSWTTALTTLLLNGMTESILSNPNFDRVITINNKNVLVSLNDLLMFTDETTNTTDYKALTEYMAFTGKSNVPAISANVDDPFINANFSYFDETNKPGDISVFREGLNGVISFSEGELARIIESLDNEEGIKKLKALYREVVTNKQTGVGNKGKKILNYNLEELSNAIHQLTNNNPDYYYEHIDIMNEFNDINRQFGHTPVKLQNLSNLNEEQVLNLLNSTLPGDVKNQIINKLSRSEDGLKILLKNDYITMPTINYVTKGSKKTLDGNKLLYYLLDNKLDYKSFDSIVDGDLTQGDIADIFLTLGDDYVINTNIHNLEDFIVNNVDEEQMKLMRTLNRSNELEREFLLWSEEELANILLTNQYVKPEDVKKLRGTFKFYDKSSWNKFLKSLRYNLYERHTIKGLHEGANNTNSVLLVKKKGKIDRDYIISTIIHEGNHGLGSLDTAGLEEALTEYNTRKQIEAMKLMDEIPKSGYHKGVLGVEKLVTSGIPGLTLDDFYDAYYVKKSDSTIAKTIDSIMGENYYKDVFTPAFDSITVSKNNAKKQNTIEKVTNDIIFKYYESLESVGE